MSRRELKDLTHKLRIYLEHQRAIGALGYIAAPADEREAFEEVLATRRKRDLRELTAALHAPIKPASSTPRQAPPAPAPSERVMPPSFVPPGMKKSTPAPPPAVTPSGGALWKQLGARPENILSQAATPPKPPIPTPPPEHAPPAPEPDEPAFKEVRRRDERPPSQRPQPVKNPSLFGEEFDRMKAPPIAGYDASPDQVKRLDTMTNSEKLSFLRECLGDCTRCKLAPTRKNIVFGDGDPNADIVFIGEGPGYNEDQQGLPFVGKAGQLLNRMIFAMGIERQDVYIANVVKCRPPDNRDPATDEIARCSPYLYKQLETINPKVVVTLGRFASQCLLDTNRSMGSMRGKWQEWRNMEVLPTYHPAFLLRNPERKREAWQDLQMVMQKLNLKGR